MYEFESFREEIVRYLWITQKLNRYTAEDLFHDCYEVWHNKVIKKEINVLWTRLHVLNYIKCTIKFKYFQQFGKTTKFFNSKYIEIRERWEIDYNNEHEQHRLDRHASVKYIELKHDCNIIMNEIDATFKEIGSNKTNKYSHNRCIIYKMHLEDYTNDEISKVIGTSKGTIASTIYQIKKQIEPKIKKLMYG